MTKPLTGKKKQTSGRATKKGSLFQDVQSDAASTENDLSQKQRSCNKKFYTTKSEITSAENKYIYPRIYICKLYIHTNIYSFEEMCFLAENATATGFESLALAKDPVALDLAGSCSPLFPVLYTTTESLSGTQYRTVAPYFHPCLLVKIAFQDSVSLESW